MTSEIAIAGDLPRNPTFAAGRPASISGLRVPSIQTSDLFTHRVCGATSGAFVARIGVTHRIRWEFC
jgi:hypothetical protein